MQSPESVNAIIGGIPPNQTNNLGIPLHLNYKSYHYALWTWNFFLRKRDESSIWSSKITFLNVKGYIQLDRTNNKYIRKEHITVIIRDKILHVEVDLTYIQNAKGKIKTFSSTIHTEERTN
jgi:hypothetical protein